MTFGPWSATCPVSEKSKQLRTLQALIAVHCGSTHPLIDQLRQAETDAMQFVASQEAFERLPALVRRKILSTFVALTWPQKDGAR